MSLSTLFDRIKETTLTTGTGNLTLAGAVTGCRTFASVLAVNGRCAYYVEAVDASGLPTGAWEVGIGTLVGATTFQRDRVYASSNSNAAVNFSAGTKFVVLDASALVLTRNYIDVALYATGGSGTPADPWTGWETAITWAVNTEYRFRAGVYAAATFPNWALNGIALIGEAGTILKHTGSGVAVKFETSTGHVDPVDDWTQDWRMENFIVQGNPNTTICVFLGGMRNGIIKHVRIRDGCTVAGFHSEACVANVADNIGCTPRDQQDDAFTTTPQYGIRLAQRAATGDQCTAWTFLNLVCERVQVGIYLTGSSRFNTFVGGTSEANSSWGLKIDAGSGDNGFYGMDMEVCGGTYNWGSPGNDGCITDASVDNCYVDCVSQGAVELTGARGLASRCAFGQIKTTGDYTFIACVLATAPDINGGIVYQGTRFLDCNYASSYYPTDLIRPERHYTYSHVPASGAVVTPQPNIGLMQQVQLPELGLSGTVTITKPATTVVAVNSQRLLFRITQPTSGGQVPVWSSGYMGTIPAPISGAGRSTYYEFIYNGTPRNWWDLVDCSTAFA